MQRWPQPSQCIFCQFRSGLKVTSKLSSNRAYHASVDFRYRERTQESPPRRPEKLRIARIDRSKSLLRSPKDTIPLRDDRNRFSKTHNDGNEVVSRQNEILRALRLVRGRYMKFEKSKSSPIIRMEKLNHYGRMWVEFEKNVTQSLEGRRKSSYYPKFIDEIMSGNKDTLRQDTERAVHFAFLDYVLDDGNLTAGSNMKVKSLDMKYPTEWYAETRQMQRMIHLHVGPTNSGKTYNALKRLEQAKSGFYAGPLRLLAHEVFSRFNDRGIKCDLVTGDDIRLDASGQVELYASTVEMVDINRASDIGVIDEIQMMGDIERGWAWTRALLGVKVKELHLCGEARVVPLIREIVASMGDTLHIHQYERLNPLKVMSRSLRGDLNNLRKGDCVVSFSIMNIHALRRQIELDTGKRCAIIYGSLPPETRAQQAALFNDPDNDYDFLAASDAIGMGLNLSIKRIVFETTMKWNGTRRERLSIPHMKQISGRAGRYRTARDDKKTNIESDKHLPSSQKQQSPQNIGLVTCLDEADLPILQNALSTDGPPLQAAGILPTGEFYEELAARLPEDTPFEYILRRLVQIVSTHPRFKLCDMKEQIQIARTIEGIENLPIDTRLTICASPASYRAGAVQSAMERVVIAIAKALSLQEPVTVADISDIPLEILDEPMTADRGYLISLEGLHKSLILYLWLSYRFPRILRDQDMAVRAKELCEEKINNTLSKFSANPKLRERLAVMKKSSEMLRDQAKANGLNTDMPMTMNPDQTVEQIDAEQINNQISEGQENGKNSLEDNSLEENIDVEGVLDLGNGDEIQEVTQDESMLQIQSVGTDGFVGNDTDLDEPKRAEGSG